MHGLWLKTLTTSQTRCTHSLSLLQHDILQNNRYALSGELHGTLRRFSVTVSVGRYGSSWNEIEESCQRIWPMWSNNRYGCAVIDKNAYHRMKKDRNASPTADEASDLLWNIVQVEEAYRQAPFLYTRPLVKGSVDSLDLVARYDEVKRTEERMIDVQMVPRTMLSLAYAGGHSMWEQEMNVLCGLIPGIRFRSLRQIEDCTRSLRICRHKVEHMVVLDQAVSSMLDLHDPEVPLHLVASITKGLVYQRYVPRLTFERMANYVGMENGREIDRMSWRTLSTLGSALAYAACLEEDLSGTIGLLARIISDIVTAKYERATELPSPSDLHALHTFLLWFSSTMNDSTVSESLLALLEKSIAVREDVLLRQSNHRVSTFQKEVWSILHSYLGQSCIMEHAIQGISVDMFIPSKCIGLEVNGPSHFYRNASKDLMTPASVYKEVMVPLVSPGYTMYHIQQSTWEYDLPTRQDKAAYLNSLINS